MVIHGSILMGTTCSQINVNMRQAAGYKADKQAVAVVRSLTKKNQFQPVDEVLRGTFRVAQKEQCFGQICAPYEIEVSELLCASAPKDDSKGAGSQPATQSLIREAGHAGESNLCGVWRRARPL